MTTERSPAARSSPGPDHPALAGLNREQRLAVTAPAGPTLVFAGAGSGKTRVITHRIAWRILEHGARPNSILAVTFTNRAAGEMRNRVEELGAQRLGPPPAGETPVRGRPWVATFHAFGLALLRRFGSDVGLPDGFAVLGADDSKALLRRVARELDVSEDLLPPAKLAPLVSRFRTGEASASARRGPRDRRRRDAVRVVADAYGERLAEDGTVDFDDLLIRALELLDRSEPAREFVAWRVGHLLVDEFQDTSPIQYRLVKRLAPHQDVFVVGDDDQSIYSFRGAEFRNILRFARDFDGTRKFTLERNYRSSGSILDAAGALIRNNAEREPKTLRAVAEAGTRVRFRWYRGEADEARAVAREIGRGDEDHRSTAVLVRTRAQTRAFEEAFTAARIPHFVVGGLRFYERKEILDAIASIRLAIRKEDDAAFLRAVGAIPRGVGKRSLERIRHLAAERGCCLLDAAARLARDFFVGRTRTGVHAFLEGLSRLRAAVETGPAAAVRSAVGDLGLGAHFQSRDRERFENLASLESAAEEFGRQNPDLGTVDFLDQVALLSAEDLAPGTAAEGEEPPVLVMTVHAAKGLEFDRVFLAGLTEGIFPHDLALRSPAGVEEERRLFYVGMTRARGRLLLSGAPVRGSWVRASDTVSRFVGEIPVGLLEVAPAERSTGPGGTPAGTGTFHRGLLVQHPKFGVGRVEAVDPDGRRLTVKFRRYGRRRLVVAYARLLPLRPSGS